MGEKKRKESLPITRGGVIPISRELLSHILSEKLGVQVQVSHAESLYYADCIGFAVKTKDERFPIVYPGSRLENISLEQRIDSDGKIHITNVTPFSEL
ncbi:putative DNA piolymerase [Paenibacillus sp. TCA20]|uniref:Uncharacterized protein n=1 Tax=Paenibacillus urinalis TaxID=521520 RepID=A0ABY7XH43_9BACL|nr:MULTISPECIES: hypothetical protein [Paenibacillus]WDI05074.1 hypothetical protein PUW25_26250 [Paenibacillus urinalis]GAK42100.1 putative DNA piolymerase [Paenibacillus sp. TCA20]